FALGGSAANLVSGSRPDKVQIGWSFLPSLLETLRVMASLSEEELPKELAESVVIGVGAANEFEWMDLLKVLQGASSGPTMRIKFMARKLLSGAHVHDGKFGVLGTPLYVAMAR